MQRGASVTIGDAEYTEEKGTKKCIEQGQSPSGTYMQHLAEQRQC